MLNAKVVRRIQNQIKTWLGTRFGNSLQSDGQESAATA